MTRINADQQQWWNKIQDRFYIRSLMFTPNKIRWRWRSKKNLHHNNKRRQSIQSGSQDLLEDHITGPKWQRLEMCLFPIPNCGSDASESYLHIICPYAHSVNEKPDYSDVIKNHYYYTTWTSNQSSNRLAYGLALHVGGRKWERLGNDIRYTDILPTTARRSVTS